MKQALDADLRQRGARLGRRRGGMPSLLGLLALVMVVSLGTGDDVFARAEVGSAVGGARGAGAAHEVAATPRGGRWSRAGADVIACAKKGEKKGETLQAPCASFDVLDVFLGGMPPRLVANFGLITADTDGRLRFSCEESLGGLAVRARRGPRGSFVFAEQAGLVRPALACGEAPSVTAIPGGGLIDVVFDGLSGARAVALGLAPRRIYRSADGGATLVPGFVFGEDEGVLELAYALDLETVYAVGERLSDRRLLVARSGDGGESFVTQPRAPGHPDGLPLDLLGVHPSRPQILFVAIQSPAGREEVWRSADGGASFSRVLELGPSESLGGFTVAEDSLRRRVYVASRIRAGGVGAGRLHVSTDEGMTFTLGPPTGDRGPRYRCLHAVSARLYACAGGEPNGDDFLLGHSDDGGVTWTADMTTAALAGTAPCRAATCAATENWLCSQYDLCAEPPSRPTPGADAATVPPPTPAGPAPPRARGSGCAIATVQDRTGAGTTIAIAIALALLHGRSRPCRRQADRRGHVRSGSVPVPPN